VAVAAAVTVAVVKETLFAVTGEGLAIGSNDKATFGSAAAALVFAGAASGICAISTLVEAFSLILLFSSTVMFARASLFAFALVAAALAVAVVVAAATVDATAPAGDGIMPPRPAVPRTAAATSAAGVTTPDEALGPGFPVTRRPSLAPIAAPGDSGSGMTAGVGSATAAFLGAGEGTQVSVTPAFLGAVVPLGAAAEAAAVLSLTAFSLMPGCCPGDFASRNWRCGMDFCWAMNPGCATLRIDCGGVAPCSSGGDTGRSTRIWRCGMTVGPRDDTVPSAETAFAVPDDDDAGGRVCCCWVCCCGGDAAEIGEMATASLLMLSTRRDSAPPDRPGPAVGPRAAG
jgi:hypothetical protein